MALMSSGPSRRTVLQAMTGLVAMTGCTRLAAAPRAMADQSAPTRYAYGDHPSQYAELSVPAGTAKVPVVVIIHGGYWRLGYGAELGRPLAVDLVGRGYAALNVEYRRVGDGGGWPQTGDDVAAAVDALRVEGQRLATGRLELNHVVALGHSAGGQLGGWLASRRAAPVSMAGAVLQAGVLDLVQGSADGLGGGAVDEFLGGSPAERPDMYASASPIALVPFAVPTVCVHGTADDVVPIDQSQRFVAAAQQAGGVAELRTFGGGHMDLIDVASSAWGLCVDAVARLTKT
jgi:acetyl esterase/lipase